MALSRGQKPRPGGTPKVRMCGGDQENRGDRQSEVKKRKKHTRTPEHMRELEKETYMNSSEI